METEEHQPKRKKQQRRRRRKPPRDLNLARPPANVEKVASAVTLIAIFHSLMNVGSFIIYCIGFYAAAQWLFERSL